MRREAETLHAPNVLVISVCSLRSDRLAPYNPALNLTPKINGWAKDAFVFTNGIAERPWQNFIFESADLIGPKLLGLNGYRTFEKRPGFNRFYVPPVDIDSEKQIWYWPETAILNYGPGLESLKQEILRKNTLPFYIFAHLKYLHYPYLDTVNMNEKDWAKLSPKSQELLAKYRAHPEDYDAQLPLIELMTNSFSLLKKKMGLKGDVFAVAGVVSDPARNARWRQTPGFADDLQLAKELYDLKMSRFDDMTADLLNLYGDEDLQKRTIVILTGDHGEAFSEHGVVGHSVNVYDEMLRFPVIVKFPGQTKGMVLDAQVTQLQLAKLVRQMIRGVTNAANFTEQVRAMDQEYVLSRNCPDTIRSARYRSEWKLIKNLDSGQNELYDLRTDPTETKNLIEEKPEMAWKLEEYMVDHQDDFKRENRNGKHARVCLSN